MAQPGPTSTFKFQLLLFAEGNWLGTKTSSTDKDNTRRKTEQTIKCNVHTQTHSHVYMYITVHWAQHACLSAHLPPSQPTFVGAVQVALDHGHQLLVLAEAGIVVAVVAEAIRGGDVCPVPQEHLHCVLTGVLTAQDQSSPEDTTKQKHKQM